MSDTKITHNQFIGIYENVLSEDDCKNIIKLFENDLKNKVDLNGHDQFFKDKMERYDYSKCYPSEDTSNLIVSKINEALLKFRIKAITPLVAKNKAVRNPKDNKLPF